MIRVELRVGENQLRRWHLHLADRLMRMSGGAVVSFRLQPGASTWPRSAERLLRVERRVLRRCRVALCDRLLPADVAVMRSTGGAPDLVLDLTGGGAPPKGHRVLRPRYDGSESEAVALAALLDDRSPTITIEELGSGRVCASGIASLEASTGLTGRVENLFSRVAALFEIALASPRDAHPALPEREAPAHRGPVAFFLRGLARHGLRTIQNVSVHATHWQVGWRFNYGPGVLETGSLDGPRWHTLEEHDASFFADPFPVVWKGRPCVFFERYDYQTQKGTIFGQPFDLHGPMGAPQLALEEPWHLSYPFLIEHEGELYMVPEASASGAISIYRCAGFPFIWEKVADLLTDIRAADSTIFRHGGRFWMTSVTRDGTGGYSDTLTIHHAPDLLGPWQPHAHRPVLIDPRVARPAGAVVERDGVLLRPVQDCSTAYGMRVAVTRIDALTTEKFAQTPVAVIEPDSRWPASRIHTVNRWENLECIDGAVSTPRSTLLRGVTRALSPRELWRLG